MPHPRIDDRQDLPEYPVRGRSARRRRAPTVWERYPLGSRIGAVVLAALLVGGVLSRVRHDDGSAAAAAEQLVVDPDAAPTDGGLAADDGSLASTSSPSDAPTVPFAEGTLPMPEGTLPPTVATTPAPTAAPATKPAPPQRNAATATTKPAVVKPVVTTAKKATPASSAKAVTKPAPATTRATGAATQPKTAIVKPPTTATTPKTTKPPATTTTVPPPKTSYTADEVVALIRQIWPADSVDKALEVAYRESRYRHTAFNGWCCYGVFQINASAHTRRLAARGLGVDGLFDPRVNIEIALEIFQESGWGPWGG